MFLMIVLMMEKPPNFAVTVAAGSVRQAAAIENRFKIVRSFQRSRFHLQALQRIGGDGGMMGRRQSVESPKRNTATLLDHTRSPCV